MNELPTAVASPQPSTDLTRDGRRNAIPVVLPPYFLRRERLLKLLRGSPARRNAVLVCAPPGYGKSSLFADYLSAGDAKVAWCALDALDAVLRHLLIDLATGLQAAEPRLGFNALADFLNRHSDASPRDAAAALAADLAQFAAEGVVIVLDDAHHVCHSEPAALFLGLLLESLPANVRLFIAGNRLPPLRLAATAGKNLLTRIGEEDLRFTVDEAQRLASRCKIALPRDRVEAILGETEGWVTGILSARPFANTGAVWESAPRPPDEIFDDVLAAIPELMGRLLMDFAALPDLDPRACNEILQLTNCADILREAVAACLFIRTEAGESGPAYFLHRQFREYLRQTQSRKDGKRLAAVQAAAARWCAAHDRIDAAIELFLEAGSALDAARLADGLAEQMFLEDRNAALKRWASALPADIWIAAPRLLYYLAQIEIVEGQLEQAAQSLDGAAAGFAHAVDEGGVLDVQLQRGRLAMHRGDIDECLRLLTDTARAAEEAGRPLTVAGCLRYSADCRRMQGDYNRAMELMTRSEAILSTIQDPAVKAMAFRMWMTVLDAKSSIAREQGNCLLAIEIVQHLLTLRRADGKPRPLGWSLNNLAYNYYLFGQYEVARPLLDEALLLARQTGNLRLETYVLVSQADILVAERENLLAASGLYAETLATARRLNDRELIAYIHGALAQLHRLACEHEAALAEIDAALQEGTVGAAEWASLQALRGMILAENARAAQGRKFIEASAAELERLKSRPKLAQALLYRAYAETVQGDHAAARASLRAAFDALGPYGHSHFFLIEVEAIRRVLDIYRLDPVVGSRVSTLLARTKPHSLPQPLAESGKAPGSGGRKQIEIRALGQERVVSGSEEVPSWGSRLPRELFFFLIDNAPVSRDTLLEVFWEHKPWNRAVANLHQTLYRIRQATGVSIINFDGGTYALNSDINIVYDVLRFVQTAEKALRPDRFEIRLERMGRAMELYTGDYRPGVDAPWVYARRSQLRNLFIRLAREYGSALLAGHNHKRAVEVLQRVQQEDPLDAEIIELSLRALAGAGDHRRLSLQYEQYRKRLGDELGIAPPAKIRELYAELIR